MAACFERTLYLGRTTVHYFDLYESNGSTVVNLDDTDYVRLAAGRGAMDPSPILDLVWGTTTTGGSGIDILDRGTATTPARVAITIGQNESIQPGTYDVEFSVVDDSVASPIADPTLPIMHGIFHIIDTIGGSVGKP